MRNLYPYRPIMLTPGEYNFRLHNWSYAGGPGEDLNLPDCDSPDSADEAALRDLHFAYMIEVAPTFMIPHFAHAQILELVGSQMTPSIGAILERLDKMHMELIEGLPLSSPQ
jgi:hypothetical protein